MSVLVKDMQMPESCLSCVFCGKYSSPPFCFRLMKSVGAGSDRLDDCPLEEIDDAL